VPEEVLSNAFRANPDVLQKLHDLGVRIAIDDFGAEYAESVSG
jgi:EAL domain-containing protein (putative c-di-GMP-specific phosphodiesterase class I)